MSLSDGVLVCAERNIHDSQNHTTEVTFVSDGDSQDELNEVIDQNQIVEHGNQNDQGEVSDYSSGTCPPHTPLKKQAEEAGSKKSITVSTAHTHLWRKHSTSIRVRKARLQAIWKQHADEKLAQKKFAEEKKEKAQKISVREKQVQERLYREEIFQAQKKLSEPKEKLLHDELKVSQVMTKAQEESTIETSILLYLILIKYNQCLTYNSLLHRIL